MTDTTKPPNRPTPSRPRPFDRDGKPERGGDKPRSRAAGNRDDARRDDSRRDPGAKTRGAEPAPPKDDARIAKVMARAGLCSRRDAESWIGAGRVAVNGTVIDSPALNVKPGDSITVDGVPLPEREQTRLFMFHKPRGLVTTARDPEGRPTIFDNLPEGLPRVVSVGRLDINTEGLMLLTNDGGLARVLELPATGWMRRYRVRANGSVDQAQLDALKGGVTIDDVDYAGIEATLDRVQGANVWLTMGLREGKNREIKRVLESLGLAVTRLIRISFGPFQLGELGEGAVESVPTRVLREQLGPALAAQAGVDLAAREEPAPARVRRVGEGIAGSRPSRSDPSAPRPHVGALRAAREEEAGEGRKRIQRSATADRKGRAVAVERVTPATGGPEGAGASRNARRFAAEKQEFRGGQKTRGDFGAAKRFGTARPARDDARPARDDARPARDDARPARDDARPARGGFTGSRTERGDAAMAKQRTTRFGADGGEGFAARPRTARSDGEGREGFAARPRAARSDGEGREGFAAKPRAPRAGRDEGERAASFAGRERREGGERVAPAPRGERPARAGGEGFGARVRDDRGTEFGAKRSFEKRPSGDRPGGDRPRSGKPNGRPGGFGSERPATGRNKPAGGRAGAARPPGGKPFGSKPFGAKPFGGKPSGGKPSDGKPTGGKPSGGKPAGGRP